MMKSDPPRKWHITVLGEQQVQNELIAMYFSGEVENCTVDFNRPHGFEDTAGPDCTLLTALDCSGKDETAIRETFIDAKQHCPKTQFFVLFNVESSLSGKIEAEALRLGVHGIFYHTDGLDCFVKGIDKVFNGELWFSRSIMSTMLKNRNSNDTLNCMGSDVLTAREKEIIQWIAKGHKNRDIARALHVSEHTIKTHIYNIYKKIDVPNRFQAVLWASQHFAFHPSGAPHPFGSNRQ